MITVGIDIGSITAKAAAMENGNVIGTHVQFTGYNAAHAGKKVFDELLGVLRLNQADVNKIVATGYGRKSVAFADSQITEISCHGKGAHFLNPGVRAVIDIGGQDSKVICLDAAGTVRDFAMNDKCAAGTGRFLEVMARALEVDLENFGDLSLTACNVSKISSVCTVFAESEVISLISQGEKRENIIAGIHESIAVRVMAMAWRMNSDGPFIMTGGVAKNKGLVKALEDKLNAKLLISPLPQENGAIGAAVMAAELP